MVTICKEMVICMAKLELILELVGACSATFWWAVPCFLSNRMQLIIPRYTAAP